MIVNLQFMTKNWFWGNIWDNRNMPILRLNYVANDFSMALVWQFYGGWDHFNLFITRHGAVNSYNVELGRLNFCFFSFPVQLQICSVLLLYFCKLSPWGHTCPLFPASSFDESVIGFFYGFFNFFRGSLTSRLLWGDSA